MPGINELGNEATPHPGKRIRESVQSGLANRQVKQVFEQAPLFVVIASLCGAAAMWLYWGRPDINNQHLLAWGGIYLLATLVRVSVLIAYRYNPDAYSDGFWGYSILINAIVFGALWGMASVLFNPVVFPAGKASEYYHQALFAALIASQAIGALAAYASSFRSFIVYNVLSILPGVIHLFLTANTASLWLGTIGSLFLVFLVLSGHRVNVMTLTAHRLQYKNESLIRYLERSKADMLDVNQKLAMEIYDRTNAEARLQEVNETLERKVHERTQALSQLNTALRQSQERLSLAIDASNIGLWDWHLPSDEIYHSNFDQLLGYSGNELTGFMGHLKPLVHPDDYMSVKKAIVVHLRKKTPVYRVSYRMRHRDGRWIWVEDNGKVIAWDHNDRPLRMIGTRRNITHERETQEKLRLSASVFDTASEAIFILDHEFRFLAVNPYFSEITHFNENEVLGLKITDNLSHPSMRSVYENIVALLVRDGHWQGEFTDYRKDGSTFPQWLRISCVRDDSSRITHYVGLFSDLTSRKEAEEKLRYLSNYDKLTGFANRNLFRDRLHAALERSRESNSRLALLFMDLDRFKQINETLGHEVGDELLKEAARRISSVNTSVDTVARVGGDEFTMILENYTDRPEIEAYCERIIAEMRRPFRIGEHELLLGGSIGISLFPDNGRDLQLLLNHADIAMHQAKRIGGNAFKFYTQGLRVASIEQLNLETNLRKAIFRDEFVVHYQPKMCLRGHKIVGVEALVRWNHPTLGLLTPSEFMPLAEETGLVSAISELVLDKACRQVQFWREAGLGQIKTSVNVAAHQLRKGNLLQITHRVIDHTGIDPKLLEFELTESTLMEDAEGTLDTLFRLRELGIDISLDDFGTGYSSLSYLKRFPIDTLKIDQAFIRDIGVSPDDEAITRAIIAMAHSLDMKVVAEGVETQEVMDFLKRENCDYIQGYFISRPVPETELSELLRRQA